MAAAPGTSTHLPAGPTITSAPITAEEVREYESILRISDQIFSGSHPRLKVPQQVVRKPGTRNGLNGPSIQKTGKKKPSVSLSGTSPVLETTGYPKTLPIPPGNAPSTAPAKAPPPHGRVASKPSSEIDPIFLTKSDDLVRAELQLQRQRVERTLRDQVDQKKQGLKPKLALFDLKPNLNVSDVLNRALELVKPVSLADPSETNGASDSFDDNSFYSSRAPDSPPLDGALQASPQGMAIRPAGPSIRVPLDHFTDELQRLEALNRPGIDQEMQDAYHVADQGILYSQKQPQHGQAEAALRLYESHQGDAMDEPEYSPPAPGEPPVDATDYKRRVANDEERNKYTDRGRDVQGPTSPAHNVRIVRNHITSPAAPRPSRVSPLAMAKVSSAHHLPDERLEYGSDRVHSDPQSGRASPNVPSARIMPRKRRKVQQKEGLRDVSHSRPNADYSDVYIKEEPVSPPPFADDPVMVRSQRPQERVYIDIASPRYTPVVERREPPPRRPLYEAEAYHETPVEQGPPRSTSRLGSRRPLRDDTDLRRVASMQYARQAEYPREYVEAEPHGLRAASYTVERPLAERPRYYEEVPAYGPRYVAVDDARQPVYREPYYEEPPPTRVMAAPQRRIVVDEHGNQYEMIPRMQPMAPPPRPVSRVPKGEQYEDLVPARAPSVRAASVVQDSYVDRRYMPEMPPPQPVYRRVPVEYARPVVGDRRSYVTPLDGPDPHSPDGSVQITESAPRRPTYIDDYVPAERMIRTASVRPPPARYEEPPEVVQRVSSVRPTGPSREVSVYMDEVPVGDYVERPFYGRGRGYYQGENGNGMPLDETAGSVQRVPPRY